MIDRHINCSHLEFCKYEATIASVDLTFWAVAAEAGAADANGPLIDPEIRAVKLRGEPTGFLGGGTGTSTLPEDIYIGQSASENLRCGRVWPGIPAFIETLRPDLDRLLAAAQSSPLQVIELGAGMGLPGLWAAARGADVTLTDTNPAVLELLHRNASLLLGDNHHQCTVRKLDWKERPEWLHGESFDLAIACDVTYDREAVDSLMVAAAFALRPGALLLLSHAERGIFDFGDALACAETNGLAWTSQSEGSRSEGGNPIEIHTFAKEF